MQNVIEDDRAGGAREGLLAGNHLIEHAAEREEVAARIEILTARLFG